MRFVCLFVRLFVCLSDCLFVVCLFVCLFVCLLAFQPWRCWVVRCEGKGQQDSGHSNALVGKATTAGWQRLQADSEGRMMTMLTHCLSRSTAPGCHGGCAFLPLHPQPVAGRVVTCSYYLPEVAAHGCHDPLTAPDPIHCT